MPERVRVRASPRFFRQFVCPLFLDTPAPTRHAALFHGKLAVAPHNRLKFAGTAKDGLGTLVLALQAKTTANSGSSVKASKRA
jgi:hypothetical protein